MPAKPVEMIPSARRLMLSLRDLGYDFPTAVAELIDNSIEAKATRVTVTVTFDGSNSRVSVADNGKGMSPEELREAMRFGSEREYDEDSLGKFGLGLKTASISQCRTFTVASRTSPKGAYITAYAWDVDHVDRTNRWEILPRSREEIGKEIADYLTVNTGTVVLWERLDRILDYQIPDGKFARKGLARMCRDLEEHLAMVFHRFLSGEQKRKISITLNDVKIAAWDPFARSEEKAKLVETREFPVSHDGLDGVVTVSPYILPHQEDFSTPAAFRLAAGPNKWNRQQGLYVYREGRLIQSGGWSKLRTIDEHTKLSRVSFDFDNSMDDAFKTNVSKMKIQIPESLREDLQEFIDPAVKSARKAYDRRDKKSKNGRLPKTKWSLKEIERALLKFANRDEAQVISRMFRELRESMK